MKRLIVCCDGTWQHLESDYPTNVVQLAQATRTQCDDRTTEQVVYYDEGVGAEGGIGAISREFTAIIGGAFGRGIDKNIMDAYRFLVLNHQPDDEIYLFGFSRGAYTVRSLAGLIGAAGLLQRHQLRYIREAYEFYRDPDADSDEVARYRAFRDRHNPQPAPIRLLGCWDTVGSLGFPDVIPGLTLDRALNRRYRFHNNRIGAHVEQVAHAVAIDEARAQFMVTLADADDPTRTQVHETWFPGDHGCIGGGSFVKRGLSSITLRWMLEQAGGLGLESDTRHIEIDVSSHFKHQEPILEGLAPEDPCIFVDDDIPFPYTAGERDPARLQRETRPRLHAHAPHQQVDLHTSVGQRWRDCAWWRPQPLAPFAATLDRWAEDHPNPLTELPADGHLAPGQEVEVEVAARTRDLADQPWRLHLEAGATYGFALSPTQVWQDGELPPCSADGWDRQDLRGLRRLLRPVIHLFESQRQNPEANWFELVGEIREDSGARHRFRLGAHPAERVQPPASGMLLCYANDALDHYDNNAGQIRLRISRLS
ncbi:DUF2235 domain-containing protein [Marichromatium gracile]|uniref:T6SS Phospholipase effector Tle1-like catalytic domain-containing protein n=1 Tax=Marichromatium gracile TaxID=1048 RepID=A0ABR5VLD0_MARGR|nr:DUF2235 domain-containing protein [Marichromatium gracile]KXX65222.1 hypothetical protein AY586_10725 [Marichromatium gracile]